MDWDFLKRKMRKALGAVGPSFVLPSVAVEIEPGFVAGVRLNTSARQVQRVGLAETEPRALEPHPFRKNIADEEELRRALQVVREAVGNGNGRLGLLIPDEAVRVALLTFESLPDDSAEAEGLVRWRMRDSLHAAPEEARVSFQVLSRSEGSVEVFAMAARNAVLAEYESMLDQMNGGPSLILPATAALLPLLPGDGGGQLLVHVSGGAVTTVVVEGSRLRFWRTRPLGTETPEELAKAVSAETARAHASARDHLKIEIEKVWLCARPPQGPEFAQKIGQAFSGDTDTLAPDPGLGAALPLEERTLFNRFGAPVAGLVSNSR